MGACYKVEEWMNFLFFLFFFFFFWWLGVEIVIGGGGGCGRWWQRVLVVKEMKLRIKNIYFNEMVKNIKFLMFNVL